jgi:arsenate reductase
MPIRVLFICTGNTARSIMAEAILSKLGGDKYAVFSAGAAPKGTINPTTLEILNSHGHETKTLYSKPLSQFLDDDFDYVITVCDNARQSCPIWPGPARMIHWSIKDPGEFNGPDNEIRSFYERIYKDIEGRIKDFIRHNP